jgi:hypothetical protein
VVEGLRDDPFRALPKQPIDLGALAPALEVLEVKSEPGPGPSAWVDRGVDAKLDPGMADKARPAIAQVGAGALPLDAPPDDVEIGSPSGRNRGTGVQLDSGPDKPKPAELPPIKTGGMTESEVRHAALHIDTDLDGKISHREVKEFGDRVRASGVADKASLAAFRRYEAGAALAATHGDVAGRQFTHEYLAKDFARELGKLGATSAEIDDAKKVILPQTEQEIAPDARVDLRAAAESRYDSVQLDAIRGYLKYRGINDGFVIDRNGNGRFDPMDKVMVQEPSGEWTQSELGPHADKLNGITGLNRVNAGAHFRATLDGTQANWFPTDHWKWDQQTKQWSLKEGVKASSAIQYYRDNPASFSGDCAAMRQLAAHSALLEQLGPDDYNAAVAAKGLSIGFGAAHDKAGLGKEVREAAAPGNPTNYEPLWQGYLIVKVDNPPNAQKTLEDSGWAGEHFVTTLDRDGKVIAMAHPFGRVPVTELADKVRGAINETFDEAQIIVDHKDLQLGLTQPFRYDTQKAYEAAMP